MMMESSNLPHLNTRASALLERPDEERIYAIRQGTWITYPQAKKIIARMEDLLAYPRITRMPNLLIVAPSFNGKTSILQRFMHLHPPDEDPSKEASFYPVVMVEMPPKPDIGDFYTRILDELKAPYLPNAPERDKFSQIKKLFRNMGVKILIVDEIHHLISGGKTHQSTFRNALKSLGSQTQVSIVAAGIEEAHHAFNTDPQMTSRFPPITLPIWRPDNIFGSVLTTLENRIPLKHASVLALSEFCPTPLIEI